MVALFFRNLLFTLLQPGMVAGVVPFLLLGESRKTLFQWPPTGLQMVGMVVFFAGFAIMTDCIIRFAVFGKGTLSPADPTRHLVTNGLYRFTRNPMYVGVMAMLLGEAIYSGAMVLWIYAAAIFMAFHLFIVFREEPRLQKAFGASYQRYRQQVRRWL